MITIWTISLKLCYFIGKARMHKNLIEYAMHPWYNKTCMTWAYFTEDYISTTRDWFKFRH